MRLIFSGIALLALVLNFEAHALSTGSLYKHCNKYAERSFEYDEVTDAMCLSYFAAVRDFGVSMCRGWKKVSDETQSTEAKVQIESFRSMEGVGDLKNVNAAIQHYVNKMKNEPERWDYRADFGVLESLQAIAPCE